MFLIVDAMNSCRHVAEVLGCVNIKKEVKGLSCYLKATGFRWNTSVSYTHLDVYKRQVKDLD